MYIKVQICLIISTLFIYFALPQKRNELQINALQKYYVSPVIFPYLLLTYLFVNFTYIHSYKDVYGRIHIGTASSEVVLNALLKFCFFLNQTFLSSSFITLSFTCTIVQSRHTCASNLKTKKSFFVCNKHIQIHTAP